MKLKFILFLFPLLLVHQALAIDVGDGSDGACVSATFLINPAKRNYQCATLNFDGSLNIYKGGAVGAGGAPLVIKVQGDIVVGLGFTIDLSGANGTDGGMTAQTGGSAGVGGGDGGNSQIGGNGLPGNGLGAAVTLPLLSFGKFIDNSAGVISYGGGGGGGSYKTKSLVTPLEGLNGNGTAGVGSNGANGNSFLISESQFDTIFSGGSGGAAGGGAIDTGIPLSGSSGGGGGGAIRIISGRNIVVDGWLIANGGNGGGTSGAINDNGGGGGGASGGSIWLQAAGTLTVSATGKINALSGSGGTTIFGPTAAGDGGDGVVGGIRLDAGGTITTAGATINPPIGYSTTFSPTAISSGNSALSRQYASTIACGRVTLENKMPLNNLINLFLGMLISSAIYFSVSRKGKI